MRTIETEIYTFAELSESAKEKAIEWYSRTTGEYWEPEFEDFLTIAGILGFHVNLRPVKLMDGSFRDKPSIYYSGFYSQGDGASFDACYCYAKGCTKAIRAYAPKDTALHSIADRLAAIQKPLFYQLTAQSKHSGRYYHEYAMSIDSSHESPELIECFRDLARWLYRQLESEYEYQTSEKYAIEAIEANEYEFDVNGRPV